MKGDLRVQSTNNCDYITLHITSVVGDKFPQSVYESHCNMIRPLCIEIAVVDEEAQSDIG